MFLGQCKVCLYSKIMCDVFYAKFMHLRQHLLLRDSNTNTF